MKFKVFSSILLAIILVLSFSHKADALSCVQTFPVVGVVSSITSKESYTEIVLDKFYTFDNSDWNINETYSIDRYENIVKEYVKNNYQLSEKPSSEYSERLNLISVPTKALERVQLKNGDIIIKGPPFHVCNYRFSGVFTKDGKLQYAIVNDSYQDYSYRNSKLVVTVGKELECDKNDKCKMEVNYQLDGKSFRLSPGQSYTPTGSMIKFVALLDSSDLKKRSDGMTMDDWGMGTYVNHIISFQDSEIKPTPFPTPTPSPNPSPTPTPVPTPEPENLNVFQKIWHWFVSLFR